VANEWRVTSFRWNTCVQCYGQRLESVAGDGSRCICCERLLLLHDLREAMCGPSPMVAVQDGPPRCLARSVGRPLFALDQ